MQVDKLKFFKEVTLRLSSSLDIEEALQSLLEYLRQFIPISFISLNYHRQEDGGMFAVGGAGDKTTIGKNLDLSQPLFYMDTKQVEEIRRSLSGKVLKYNEDISIIKNFQDETFQKTLNPIFIKTMDKNFKERFSSFLSIDLKIKGQNLGNMDLFHYKPNMYTYEHAELMAEVLEPIAIAASNFLQVRQLIQLKNTLADENVSMRLDYEHRFGHQIIGTEFGMRRVMEMVWQVAPLPSPVLLLGETGTGKELVANSIHLNSPRNKRPMIRVQCGAIPDTLLDSELFGHEKGAFTGAVAQKRGRFERADKSTIFLDEIGELSLDAQVKLLRVLQEMELERLGSSDTIKVDVRVIAATNRDLEELVKQGKFREDLFFRLNVFPIVIPPLRERKEDIPALATHFIDKKTVDMGLSQRPTLPGSAYKQLREYNWPGNIRELQNIIERAMILSRGSELVLPNLKVTSHTQTVVEHDNTEEQTTSLDEMISGHIATVLEITRGKIEGEDGAAHILGIHPSTLRSKMRKMGIPFGKKAGK